MSDPSETLSGRSDTRTKRRARREMRGAWREVYFELLTAGHSLQTIAKTHKVSVDVVRRAVDQAIAERRLDAPERFVHLQVARLNKALQVADHFLTRADHRAVGPYLKVVAELDRYHGLAARYRRLAAPAGSAEPPASPPLFALTHAAPPLEPASPTVLHVEELPTAPEFSVPGEAAL